VERGHYPAEALRYRMAVKGLMQSDPHDARILKAFALGLAVATRGMDHLRNRVTLEINARINDDPAFKERLYGMPVSGEPTAEQQAAVDRVELEFREAQASPPSAAEALGRAGVRGDEEHDLFQVLLESRRLVRVKESLFFHADALEAIQEKLVALLRERKEIGPGDIKDLLGISRKYAIPLLEFFDARRVTTRVGERRVLRGA